MSARWYQTPEDFDAMVDLYLETCRAESNPVCFRDLALFMGLGEAQCLYQYEKYEEMRSSLERAKHLLQLENQRRLGRPRKYSTPAEFDAMVDMYLIVAKEQNEPLTFTGMALFLGFSSRDGIDIYKTYDGFSGSVERARALVQMGYENGLHTPSNAGARFALTNYGWKNASSVDVSSKDGSMTPRAAVDASVLDDETLEKIMEAKRRGGRRDTE